ncbi:hypothetical protein MKX34_17090 [Paenibacillus sp. FSL R5-0636]|uniref:hypothetical protein n=1 Tax=Paenibacillus TaxID=44249 RepID=UPI00096FC81C|nr:hypothetical protein [Paenibacillus odorifer]OMD03502.1 hypothetical protein BJP49_01415 [Paenibacillus odorifer]
MEIINVHLGKTVRDKDEVEFTLFHEGRSVRFKCTRTDYDWNVYYYAVEENNWLPKIGEFKDIIKQKTGYILPITRHQFIEEIWKNNQLNQK